MADRVTFTPGSAERIAKVVRTVEAGNRDTEWRPPAPRTVGGGAKVFRMCTFTGSWDIDTQKVCTFLNVTNTPNTVSAYNVFANISGSTSTTVIKHVGIAKDGTAWYAIAAECS